MLRRTNTCRLTDQLMVNKELIWHGVLWQNRQNEGLWPAKWGGDLQQHNLWNLCLPVGDTSPPAAFDQCAAPTAVPACQPPTPSFSCWRLTDLLRDFFARVPNVLVSTVLTAPLLRDIRYRLIDNSKLCEFKSVLYPPSLAHSTLSLWDFWDRLQQHWDPERRTIDRKYTKCIQFFYMFGAVRLLGASSSRTFRSVSSTWMAGVSEAGR